MIDTLTTKDNMSYTHLKQQLMNIERSEIDDDLSLFVSRPSTNNKKGKGPIKSGHSDSSSSLTTYTSCKKHNPRRSEGHTWNECFRPQTMNKEKKEKDEKDLSEEANSTTDEQKVKNNSFYFDTACTSHMATCAVHLLKYWVCGGFVKSSSPKSMEIASKGDVMMDCLLRDGSISSVCV